MAKGEKLYSFDGKHAVRLDLSRDEVDTLYALLGAVGGDLHRSPNRHAYAVYLALETAGVDWDNVAVLRDLRKGDFEFADYPAPFRKGYYRCTASADGKTVKHFDYKPTNFHQWEPVTVTAEK